QRGEFIALTDHAFSGGGAALHGAADDVLGDVFEIGCQGGISSFELRWRHKGTGLECAKNVGRGSSRTQGPSTAQELSLRETSCFARDDRWQRLSLRETSCFARDDRWQRLRCAKPPASLGMTGGNGFAARNLLLCSGMTGGAGFAGEKLL